MAFCALDRIKENTHLPEVRRFNRKYILAKTMIRGKYHAIASGFSKITHNRVLIKSVYQPESCEFKEVSVLKKLLHVPGVVNYLDHYAIKCDIYFLVMEYFGQMNLKFFLTTNGPVSEKMAHSIFKQLFVTIQSCFEKKILHKKVIPRNILINTYTNQVKIANFNSASEFDSEEFTSPLSLKIAPPEYFQSHKYTADGLYVWTLGLILYELLFNISPFSSPHDVINAPLIIPPHKQYLSLDVITFLKWLLAKSKRITLHQIAHHPWITKQWI
jgi:serine/threonine protein kinase